MCSIHSQQCQIHNHDYIDDHHSSLKSIPLQQPIPRGELHKTGENIGIHIETVGGHFLSTPCLWQEAEGNDLAPQQENTELSIFKTTSQAYGIPLTISS